MGREDEKCTYILAQKSQANILHGRSEFRCIKMYSGQDPLLEFCEKNIEQLDFLKRV
jgi:hypothetical protein